MSLARLGIAGLTLGVLGGFAVALLRPQRGRLDLVVQDVPDGTLSVKHSITASGAVG